jgi:YbbR domain-containing protein
MRRLFAHPAWLKVLSVVLSILLWVYVLPTYTTETTRSFELPLHVISHPTFKLLSGPTDYSQTIKVTVSGKRLLVSRVTADLLKATVDYSKVTTSGPQTVEVEVTGPADYKVSYSPMPSSVPVTLVENRDDLFPLTVEPATGVVQYDGKEFRYRTRLENDRVPITGRSDFLSRVFKGRAVLDPALLDPTISSLTLPVTPIDTAGKSVDNLETKPVVVRLLWEELPPSKEFMVTAVTGGTLPPGYTVKTMVVEPKTVKVRATVLGGKLPPSAVVETAPIDLTGKTRSFTTAISLLPAPGLTAEPQTVSVTVEIVEATVEKIFKGVPVTVRGVAAGHDAVLTVTDVQIRVKGPSSMIGPLGAASIVAYIDAEGLQDGKHLLPVKVTVPPGLGEVIADPAVIEVLLKGPQ